MRWVAHLVRTMTGQVGKELQITSDGSWEIPLNGLEDFTVTVSKEELRKVDRDWWSEDKASILISIEYEEGDLEPWVAGPIIAPPSESRDTVTFQCGGIGHILQDRVVLRDEFVDRDNPNRRVKELANSIVTRVGRSLGSIAQDIVVLGTNRKLGGFLPIVFRSPREEGSRLNQRNYKGYNLSNNGLWKRLTEISNVRNGPDFMFRPEWADDTHNMLVWAMYHGTVAQPTIDQDWTMSLDTTAIEGPVSQVSVSRDSSSVCSRVYWTGAGEGAGTLIRIVQDESRLEDYMPLKEMVGSTSDSSNPDLIQEHAEAALAAGATPITQVSLKVRVDQLQSLIGRWHVGDQAKVIMSDEWLSIGEGSHNLRIISAKGNFSTFDVDLEFQPDGEAFTPEENTDEED